MKVCYFGTYREEYTRNKIMIEGLNQAGVKVLICHEKLWQGIEDRVQTVSNGWYKVTFWVRLIRAYCKLISRYLRLEDHDIVIVGYPGQLDVLIAKLLCLVKRKILVWDIFMSIYLISVERELDKKFSLSVRLLKILESISIRIPDLLILDTPQYISWFKKTYKVSTSRFNLVPTGANDLIYRPQSIPCKNENIFRILYFGTYIPNHHVVTIIEAANLLKENLSIQFELIGDGPDKKICKEMVQQMNLKNITFIDWIDEDELVKHIDACDVCLGAFGSTPQSTMTIQNKIYIGLAMAKPVITGDSEAIQDQFIHLEHIYLCKRKDPKSLAHAIQGLADDPDLCKKLSINGYKIFKEKYSIYQIGKTFREHLEKLIN